MDPCFFLDLTVETGVELTIWPSSSAISSVNVEVRSLGSEAWVTGLVAPPVFVGSGALAAALGAGAGAGAGSGAGAWAGAVVGSAGGAAGALGLGAGAVSGAVGGTEVVGVGSGIAAVVAGVVSISVAAVGGTSLRSYATGNSEGRPSAGRIEAAALPSAAAGRSEGSFP
jgi:hypothetical protein